MKTIAATSTKEESILPLELLTLREENASLRAEVKYYRNRAARLDRYIKTQMKPLVRMGIEQGGRIKTLERQVKRMGKDKMALLGQVAKYGLEKYGF